MDNLIQKFKTIPLNAKVTISVKSWPHTRTADLLGTLIEHPRQKEDGRWSVKVRLERQKRIDEFELGTNVTDVREGWGRRSKS